MVWNGITLCGWLRVLAWHRGAIQLRQLHRVLGVAFWGVANSVATLASNLIYGRRIKHTAIQEPPIFILGHWRSGTTLLHELMVLDKRFGYPTTYACMAPNHFLVSWPFAYKFLGFLLPEKRPMDNMETGWDRPQEEEFAFCNMGMPSPYWQIAFPNQPPRFADYLTLEGLPAVEVERWQRQFRWFLQAVTALDPRPLVLKSPTHTGRIKTLLAMFPNAKFVHIVRDPYAVFSSTVHLWKRLYEQYGMQTPTFDGLEDHVLDTFFEMYDAFDREQSLIPPGNFSEVRYEDLVRDPVEQIRRVYDEIGLEGFADVRSEIERYQAAHVNYQTNRFELPEEVRKRVASRWRNFIERHGYERA